MSTLYGKKIFGKDNIDGYVTAFMRFLKALICSTVKSSIVSSELALKSSFNGALILV